LGGCPLGDISKADFCLIPRRIVVKDYPRVAAMASDSGDVVCEVTISADGKVGSVAFKSGNKRLYLFTTDMLKKWEFKPDSRMHHFEITVRYVLSNDRLPDSEFLYPNLLVISGAPRRVDATPIVEPKNQ
jgi:TonB family protein